MLLTSRVALLSSPPWPSNNVYSLTMRSRSAKMLFRDALCVPPNKHTLVRVQQWRLRWERVKYFQRLLSVYLHLLRLISVFLDQRKPRGRDGKDDIFVCTNCIFSSNIRWCKVIWRISARKFSSSHTQHSGALSPLFNGPLRECIFTNCVPLRNSMSSLIWRCAGDSWRLLFQRATNCAKLLAERDNMRAFFPLNEDTFYESTLFALAATLLFFLMWSGARFASGWRVQLAKGGTIASGLSATIRAGWLGTEGPCCDISAPRRRARTKQEPLCRRVQLVLLLRVSWDITPEIATRKIAVFVRVTLFWYTHTDDCNQFEAGQMFTRPMNPLTAWEFQEKYGTN